MAVFIGFGTALAILHPKFQVNGLNANAAVIDVLQRLGILIVSFWLWLVLCRFIILVGFWGRLKKMKVLTGEQVESTS